jgi:Na+(H+)/acetate symporter ActP
MNGITIGIFAAIIALTLAITAWATRRTRTATDFYAAGKGLTAAQNGFALAGDWCSAAAFLGFTGLTALYGAGGALYAIGPLVAFCDRRRGDDRRSIAIRQMREPGPSSATARRYQGWAIAS